MSIPPKRIDSDKNTKKTDQSPKTIAIALEEQSDSAPKIIATGRGFIAEQILDVAFANDVKVREDSDLAQILSAIDVDSPIPTNAFTAVAQVLAYLYAANGQPAPASLGEWHDLYAAAVLKRNTLRTS